VALAKRILVVDDIPHIRQLMSFVVNSHHQFQVCCEAFDGFDAVEQAPALQA
jgi:chemotaxis response regulator CheB